MKRVLVVAYFYPPVAGGGVYRTLGFARHLPSFGIEPVVLTGAGSTPWVTDPGLLAAVSRIEAIRAGGGAAAAETPRGDASRPAWKSALARFAPWIAVPDAYARWRSPAVHAGLSRIGQGGIDAIYSTSPPDTDHLVALDLHRASGLPWVADFRDPWIGLSYRRPPTPWHRAAHETMLRAVLGEATRVVAATEGTKRWLTSEMPSAAPRLSVIENGFEAEEWTDVVPHRFDRFTVLHAGRLSGERTLQPFLDGLARFLARNPSRRAEIECLLLGPHDAAEARRVERAGFSDVIRFVGQTPHAATLAMEAGANALLLIQSGAPEYRDLVPGKLYEYMGAGRPVIAIAAEGPAADLVRRLGMGWVAPPDSADRIADALDAAWSGSITPRGVAADRAPFTRRALAGQLARLLEEIA
jgi:glycosyltransferase involved in cell wall biosynthesis